MAQDSDDRILVLGGGLMGLAVAHALGRRGVPVPGREGRRILGRGDLSEQAFHFALEFKEQGFR